MTRLQEFLRSLRLVIGLLASAAVFCVIYIYVTEGKHSSEQLAECRLLWKAGDVAGAKRELVALHAQDESNADVLELLAEIELSSGSLPKSIEWLRRIPESEPRRAAMARSRAAQIAMQLGQVRDTELLAREAVRLDPSFAEPRRLLMRYYFVLLQHSELYEQSVELDTRGELSANDLLMRCLGHRASWDDDEHVAWLEMCLRKDPSNGAVRAALARNYAVRDRGEDSWRVLNVDLPGAAQDWRVVLARAEQEINEGRFELAAQTLERLPKDANTECRAWLAKARVWMETGETANARIALDNVAKLDPYDPTSSYMMSRLAMSRDDPEEANKYFHKSQQLKELMGLLSRLVEASNPAYHPDRPIEVTVKSARESLLNLGFRRESEILQGFPQQAGKANEQVVAKIVPTNPVGRANIGELVSPTTSTKTARSSGPERPSSVAARSEGPIGFQDVAGKIGLSFQYDTGNSRYKWLMETLGGGVAVLDFDLDGWDDVYLTQAGPLPIERKSQSYADRLFRNLYGDAALDVSTFALLPDSGYGQGCAVGDYDQDGFPDLVVCNYGELLVHYNQGDGTFTDAVPSSGIKSANWSTSAAFHDLDRDGDLDLYVVQYVDAPYDGLKPCLHQGSYTSCRPFLYNGEHDLFWENLGDGRFADRSTEFGLTAPDGKGLGIAIADFDRSGYESIFVANDTSPNFLFTRSSDRSKVQFHESAVAQGIAVNGEGLTEACMGVGLGDVNGDGRFDLHITTFQGETSTLYVGSSDGGFVDETEQAGLASSSRNRMGWGCQFLDLDCNGDLDLFVANGHLHDPPQLSQLFYNQGGGRFTEVSRSAGNYFRKPWMGRSVALIDWNRDMLSDLVVTYQRENTSLLQNTSSAGNRVVLKLVGVESNRDAVGAVVEAQWGERTSHFYVTRGGGYFAANDPKVLIGCGTAEKLDRLKIKWPSGQSTSIEGVLTGTTYLVTEGQGAIVRIFSSSVN